MSNRLKSDDRPLRPDDLLSFNNAPAPERIPEEVARQLGTRRVAITWPGAAVSPEQHLLKVDGRTNGQQWLLPDGAVLGLPGRTAKRMNLKSHKPSKAAATKPFRPAWAEQTYHPKRTIAAPWTLRPTRKEKHGEVYYGVFPPEDRNVYYPSGYPWHCVGRVFVWNDASAANWAWWGSAVLVGPRVVLTAGHVVPWDATTWMMQFIPSYYDGKSLSGAGANSWVSDAQGWDVSYKSRYPDAFDLAVLRLYDPLGDSLGYFGSKTYSEDWNGGNYFNVTGYPSMIASAERPSYELGIAVVETDTNSNALRLDHRGDTTGGDSGAPFWGTWPDGFPYAVGTVSGGVYEGDDKDFNIAAGGQAMVDLIRWGLTNWP